MSSCWFNWDWNFSTSALFPSSILSFRSILANKLDTSDAAFSSSVRSSNARSTSFFSDFRRLDIKNSFSLIVAFACLCFSSRSDNEFSVSFSFFLSFFKFIA
uniref:Uncharacterized protein n=1 Tax=Rhizophora mucronata TaxID=61149 RepID=A0A2P2MQ24_RHIMU